MTAILAFILQCAAVAALVALATGALVWLVALLARRLFPGRLSASGRADLWLIAVLLPAMAAVAMAVATAAPALANALGLGHDHCSDHGHHLHVCFLHATDISLALTAVGGLAFVWWLGRVVSLAGRLFRSERAMRLLARMGRARPGVYPVVVVPGNQLCHATGIWRPRVLVSADLVAQLSRPELEGALAHEEAHLRRRDPLASCLAAVASTFLPAPLSAWLRRQYRQAAEAACDGAAAARVASPAIVATALVKAATIQRQPPAAASGCPAFGVHALETRVRALLAGQVSDRPARWLLFSGITGLAFLLAVFALTEPLHHLAETVLGRIF